MAPPAGYTANVRIYFVVKKKLSLVAERKATVN